MLLYLPIPSYMPIFSLLLSTLSVHPRLFADEDFKPLECIGWSPPCNGLPDDPSFRLWDLDLLLSKQPEQYQLMLKKLEALTTTGGSLSTGMPSQLSSLSTLIQHPQTDGNGPPTPINQPAQGPTQPSASRSGTMGTSVNGDMELDQLFDTPTDKSQVPAQPSLASITKMGSTNGKRGELVQGQTSTTTDTSQGQKLRTSSPSTATPSKPENPPSTPVVSRRQGRWAPAVEMETGKRKRKYWEEHPEACVYRFQNDGAVWVYNNPARYAFILFVHFL